ncbi:hypothetical protein IHN32_00705 [Deinococcus sp. 14RED07]|uniref:hypothetical protein n=1 Tax=unclassified Deinococcus TaxID=2623546 RepID=UPI001E51E94C|nr:hypothetical protein [Deinococcus sp. 14RED07]MCD0174476.1 hypothetical protein [Deinococcus sp. 14RED07]
MGIKSKRVAFTFDDHSVRTLEQMTQEGRFSSMADTVRESLQISRALQTQARRGFTEIVMRNPETQQERVVVVPRLASMVESNED